MKFRTAMKIAAALGAAFVLVVVLAIVTLRSPWFYNKVREGIISTVENATGGRVEIGAFRFDWRQLRAEVTDFTLHGTEPFGKPPLVHARRVGIVLKIISLWKRDVDIRSLDVASPNVYLIVAADGSTNIPKPKTPPSKTSTMQTLLKLAIGQFALWNGVFEIEKRGKTPFEFHGENLSANLEYDAATPRYHGQIAIQPLEAKIDGFERTPFTLSASISAELNRIAVESAKVTAQGIDLAVSGDMRDFNAPRFAAKYTLHTEAMAAQRFFRIRLVNRGAIDLAGNGVWDGGDEFSTTGAFHAYRIEFRSGATNIRNVRGDGQYAANPRQIVLSGLRYSGAVNQVAVNGHIETTTLRGEVIDARGLVTSALGGTFRGNGQLRRFDRFTAEGAVAGLQIQRAVALYSKEPLPWDGVVSGNVKLEGSLQRTNDVVASANLTISPAAQGPPVYGQLAVLEYNTRTSVLNLGDSTLSLPNTTANFSGALGQQLRVHVETHDFNDFLPVLGQNAGSLPVMLHNGAASFDGTASGSLDAIQAAGHVTATHAIYNNEPIDSFAADVTASPAGVQVQNGTAARGALHAQFHFTAGLHDWKTEDSLPLSGAATVHDASVSDIAAVLKIAEPPAKATLNVTAQVSGTFGDPKITADVTAGKGSIQDEPFDHLAARLAYSGHTAQLTGGEVDAPGKRITLTASYAHSPNRLDTGTLRFQLASNEMSLKQIRVVQRERPGAEGTLQIATNGAIDLMPPSGGRAGYRIEDLHVNVFATGLRMSDQPFGDIRLTANTENGALRTHLESNFANSSIQGDGLWQLTGDYPGATTITFSKLDFAQLYSWLSPGGAEPDFAGSAEGQLHISGNALKPETFTAELRIPKFQIAPAEAPTPSGNPFVITNAAPIVALLSNSTINVESAHLIGPSTDISLTGKATLRPKPALDLRATGKIDMALVHDFNRDLTVTGVMSADATIRGDLSSPQVNGRLQFQNATFYLANFPNGLTNTTGTITFAGSRATIQELSAETGGGKVQITGFATYQNRQAVFRLHARANQVRVRKPEGVSTVANADLTLTGTSERSLLAGSVTIVRLTFTPESDFSSLISSSSQPVETPSAQTGFLGGLGLDVQINTSPDIQVQSSLTQDVQLDANLHLRGTVTNPALLGRINITEGQLQFFGTKYQISDGSISFFNPVRIAPVLDIDLVTKARGVEITLAITGPIDHLTLTPSSDSSLNYNDIISLLVTGRAPTQDPALLSGQNALGVSAFQQMGASALLGQAIAAPVTGRLQRFFGVSSLRIDPTIPGFDANPAARLTLEQQVTPNITFTYITSVTTTNPQIIQVEWAINKTWSIVTLREENGVTGMDIYFKRRF